MSSNNKSFISAAKLVSVLTLVSRILGLVRDAVMARYFGSAILHYFGIPFQIPNLARRLFGEGALTAALIPVYTDELHKDPEKASLLSRSVFTLLIIFLSGVTVIGLGVLLFFRYGPPSAGYGFKTLNMLSLAAIMLPYMVLICSVAIVGGLLQVHRHFLAPAAAPAFLNITIIVGVLFFSRYFGADRWDQIFAAAWAVLVAGVIQFAIQLPALKKHGISLKPRFVFTDQSLKKVFVIMGPMIVGLAAVQINTVLDNLIAFFLSSTAQNGAGFTLFGHDFLWPVHEGSVNYLYNAQRCYQFPLGVFGIALATAIFPYLTSCVSKNDMEGFSKQLNHGIRLTIFIGFPSTVGMILASRLMVKAIFEGGEFTELDTNQTSWTLVYYAIGITAYCMQQLVVRAFYSFKDSKTPVVIAVRMIVLNFLMNIILIWPLATGGLGLATAFSALVQSLLLLHILIKRYGLDIHTGIMNCVLKCAAGSAIMAIAGWYFLKYSTMFDKYSQLLLLTVVCAVVYYFVSVIIKTEELSFLKKRAG